MGVVRNLWATIVSAFVVAMLLGLAIVPAASASKGCENEARRVEQASTSLPDCRAYELVTPPSMPTTIYPSFFGGRPPGGRVGEGGNGVNEYDFYLPIDNEFTSAIDGNAALVASNNEPNSQSLSAFSNLSLRGSTGWTGQNIQPPTNLQGFLCDVGGYAGFSANLEQIVMMEGLSESSKGDPLELEKCGHEEPRLVPGEPEESANMFLRDTATGSYQLINVTPPGVTSYQPHFDAISADGSHVVFESKAQLTTDAPPPPKPLPGSQSQPSYATDIYVWSSGKVHLLTVLPNGTAMPGGALAGALPTLKESPWVQSAEMTHAISPDGERVLFYAGGEFESALARTEPEHHDDTLYRGGGLYLRLRPGADQSALNGSGECTEPLRACTIQIDVTERGSGSSGNGQFRWASTDTSKIFFTDEERLTPGSTAQAGKPDLYEYDLEKPTGQRLTDLTANVTEPADVLGVSGASEDGSYIYFVATGNLTGPQENSRHATALAGEPNLYLRHNGATTYIATLDPRGPDRCDWVLFCLTARVSTNGAFIGFNSIYSLTGYDNAPVQLEACAIPPGFVPKSPCTEIFRYAVAGGSNGGLTCVSCNPDGSAPRAQWAYSVIDVARLDSGGGYFADGMQAAHNVSDDGAVFFDTMERLLPADENEVSDVYEYEGGEGSSVQLYLISSGKSEFASYLDNATPSGSDVFFVTDQSLVRADTRRDYSVYDARVGGGFATQNEAVQAPLCEALEACRSPLTEAPAALSAASATLQGAGNLAIAPQQTHAPGQSAAKRPKTLTRKQRLARALKSCTRKYRHNTRARQRCERRARVRYGSKTSGGRRTSK